MKYSPYISVNDVAFGASEEETINTLGEPIDTSLNDIELKELNYENAIYRFDKRNSLVEATINIKEILLHDNNVQFAHLKNYIYKNDIDSFETVGFHVSPKFGIAFDPNHKYWVTIFSKSELREWQHINE